jgi:hypothetical protein
VAGVPQLAQKLVPVASAVPQLLQCMVSPFEKVVAKRLAKKI